MNLINRTKFIPVYLYSILPFRILYLFSDMAFFVIYHIIKYRRKVVRTNLENSFPDKSIKEITELEKRFYHHFLDIMVEILKSLTISKKSIRKRFKVINPEIINKYFAENKSIVFYTSHQGNWEWLSFMPIFTQYTVTAFITPPSSGYFRELMELIRCRFGMICIEANKGYKTLLQYKQKGIPTLNLIAGDQRPQRGSTKHWVEFLNQETGFFIGVDRIAKKSDQVIIFPYFKRVKRGYYEVDFTVIEENPKNSDGFGIIDCYTHLLEQSIIKSPEMWLWSHKRWKIKRHE
jgi:Kdo2-lipid IVA lauroyltransferase/acyltransferase